MNDKLIAALEEKFSKYIIDRNVSWDTLTVVLKPEGLLKVVEFLKGEPEFKYDFLEDLCGADYPDRDERFETIYMFYSPRNNHRFRIKVPLKGKNPTVDSLTGIFAGANWPERETYDMFGIKFKGHPNLKRILLFEEFSGFPLRKDFPIEGRDRGVFPKGNVMNNKIVNAVDIIQKN